MNATNICEIFFSVIVWFRIRRSRAERPNFDRLQTSPPNRHPPLWCHYFDLFLFLLLCVSGAIFGAQAANCSNFFSHSIFNLSLFIFLFLCNLCFQYGSLRRTNEHRFVEGFTRDASAWSLKGLQGRWRERYTGSVMR